MNDTWKMSEALLTNSSVQGEPSSVSFWIEESEGSGEQSQHSDVHMFLNTHQTQDEDG